MIAQHQSERCLGADALPSVPLTDLAFKKANRSHWIFNMVRPSRSLFLPCQCSSSCLFVALSSSLPPAPLKLLIRTVTISFLGGARYLSIKLLSCTHLSGRLTSAHPDVVIRQGSAAVFPLLPRMKRSVECAAQFLCVGNFFSAANDFVPT